jgi:hypothetical protein
MVSKDQTIGGIICLVCVVIAVLYTAGLFYFGEPLSWNIQFWLVTIPVFIAFISVMFIGAWIGWTMATTPPPKPIEEITSEIEEEEKEEEKVPKAAEEEQKPERKRKSKK